MRGSSPGSPTSKLTASCDQRGSRPAADKAESSERSGVFGPGRLRWLPRQQQPRTVLPAVALRQQQPQTDGFPGLTAVSHSKWRRSERGRRQLRREEADHDSGEEASPPAAAAQAGGMDDEEEEAAARAVCKCLETTGMSPGVSSTSSDQCRLYGPEFVVKYGKLHARIEALRASAFSALDNFEPRGVACYDGDGEPVVAGASEFFACDDNKDDHEGCRDRVLPPPLLLRSNALGHGRGGLIPCTEVFDLSSDNAVRQAMKVCSHLVGTCDAHEKWVRRNLQN
ncbi:GTPase IMAP family member 9-like protein [Lates japonicus]|uniref:GTPase IMAP family member 9-like protein n=1 Tax=Lates japonicus TaxID=270547 RepID=A0AAD3N707_LATJO|nr:GTPase IMAP family member 9-like protein [Lates japonicus]GLD67798.1 GTPase IMAP family member 9-like protein [Lates japonicus]